MLFAAAAITIARPPATPGPPLRDFEAYYAAGQTARAHADPYTSAIWNAERGVPGVDASRVELLPFVGPPAFLPVFAALGLLAYPFACAVWMALLCGLLLIMVLVLLARAGELSAGTVAASILIAIGFGPLSSDLLLGQGAAIGVACSTLAVLLLESPPLAFALIFCSAIQPNIAIALFSQLRRRTALITGVAAACVFAFVCVAIVGPAQAAGYFQILRDHGVAERFAIIQITPASIAYGFGASPGWALATDIAVAIAALMVWAIVMRTSRMRSFERLAFSFALLPFVMPFFHEHDFVALFPVVIWYVMQADNRSWPLLASVSLLCAIDWLGIAQRPHAFMQMALLCLTALCGLFALCELRLRALLLPLGVIGLFLLAGLIAQHTTAPVWPDAMRPGTVDLHLPAASIWQDELQRTGQIAIAPFLAALRLLTLIGSGLLAWYVATRSRGLADSRSPSWDRA